MKLEIQTTVHSNYCTSDALYLDTITLYVTWLSLSQTIKPHKFIIFHQKHLKIIGYFILKNRNYGEKGKIRETKRWIQLNSETLLSNHYPNQPVSINYHPNHVACVQSFSAIIPIHWKEIPVQFVTMSQHYKWRKVFVASPSIDLIASILKNSKLLRYRCI